MTRNRFSLHYIVDEPNIYVNITDLWYSVSIYGQMSVLNAWQSGYKFG